MSAFAPRGLTTGRTILIAVLAGLLAPACLIILYLTRHQAEALHHHLRAYTQHEAELIALNVANTLATDLSDNQRQLQDLLAASTEGHPYIKRITLVDKHGRLLTQYQAKDIASLNIPLSYTVKSLIVKNAEQYGEVRLDIDETAIEDNEKQERNEFILILVVQVLSSTACILFILNRRITIPLRRLSQQSDYLAEDSNSATQQVQRNDEIGLVAKRLQLTGRAMRTLFSSLEQQNQHFAHDLRERERIENALRDSEQKFSTLFHYSPVAMALLRREDTAWLDINRALHQLLGTRNDNLLGKTSAELGFFSQPEERERLYAQLDSDGYIEEFSAQLRRTDGRIIDALIHMRMIQMDVPCILAAVIDITALRNAQRKVEDLNLRLEERVQERAGALTKSNQELEKALTQLQRTHTELVQSEKLAALGSLVAGIAHELNTPIGNSLMVASTLRDIGQHLSDDFQTDKLKRSSLEYFITENQTASDILMRNLTHAAELITSFKQVAVDQTSSQRRRFKLAEVTHEIIITLQPQFRKTPFLIDEAIPGDIVLDSYPGPLGQVISNLLSNCLMHAFDERSSGHISLTAQLRGTDVIFRCKDDGHGISQTNLTKIFNPFFTTKLGKQGSGLGLNIVHNIVTGILGGDIQVSSDVNVGTSFTLRLPLNAPQTQSADDFPSDV